MERGADADALTPALLAESGAALRAGLRRASRRSQIGAVVLLLPLVLFLLVTFVAPLGLMLLKGVEDKDFARSFPATTRAIAQWDGRELPSRETMATFSRELMEARGTEHLSLVANRLNFDINGLRSLLLAAARKLPADAADAAAALQALDPRWAETETWGALRRATGRFTDFYLLDAIDLKRSATGEIGSVGEERAIFRSVFLRTLWISLLVTLICAVLGYPVAYLLATQPPGIANLLMILVLLPFWTSLLVRTTAWVVLLQSQGVVNSLLIWLGAIDAPLKLIYNRVGVCIAISHVLLPFMILPLYSVMKGIGPQTMRAAVSLGAHPFEAFARVYFPQTLPGVMAGSVLVFISAIGYYITPALVGGADDQMVSYFIAFYTNQTLNWGLAAALGTVLLVATLLLYAVYARLVGTAGPRWS